MRRKEKSEKREEKSSEALPVESSGKTEKTKKAKKLEGTGTAKKRDTPPKKKKKVTKKSRGWQKTIAFFLVVGFFGYALYSARFYNKKLNEYTIMVTETNGVLPQAYEPEQQYWIWQKIIPYNVTPIHYVLEPQRIEVELSNALPSAELYENIAQTFFKDQFRRLGVSFQEGSSQNDSQNNSKNDAFAKPSFRYEFKVLVHSVILPEVLGELYQEGITPEKFPEWRKAEGERIRGEVLESLDALLPKLEGDLPWDEVTQQVNRSLNFSFITKLTPVSVSYPDLKLYQMIRDLALDPTSSGGGSSLSNILAYQELGSLLERYPSLNTPQILDSLLLDVKKESE